MGILTRLKLVAIGWALLLGMILYATVRTVAHYARAAASETDN